MSKPLITIAGETREMNDEELAQLKKDQQEWVDEQKKLKAEKEAKEKAKAVAEAKLIALGLTKADIEAILG